MTQEGLLDFSKEAVLSRMKAHCSRVLELKFLELCGNPLEGVSPDNWVVYLEREGPAVLSELLQETVDLYKGDYEEK